MVVSPGSAAGKHAAVGGGYDQRKGTVPVCDRSGRGDFLAERIEQVEKSGTGDAGAGGVIEFGFTIGCKRSDRE